MISASPAQKLQAPHVPHELLVKFRGPVSHSLMETPGIQAEVVETFDFQDTFQASDGGELVRLRLPHSHSLVGALELLGQSEQVEFAEPNYLYTLQSGEPANPPNDFDNRLWGLENTGQTGGKVGADVRVRQAWQSTTGLGGKQGPLIAVIDTGVDYTHPDLKENLWVNPGEIPNDGIDNDGNGVIDDVHGYNAFADNGDPWDHNSHGTHVAGTIAAVGNNGLGITGVMQQANLMPVKIFGPDGTTSSDVILRGVLYSAKMGADITSNSWGGRQDSRAIYEAFKAHPALHVVAAGNRAYDNDRHDQFPANYDLDNIVAVAATTHLDQRAPFSQWGANKVDVAAPGDNIYSTLPQEKYGFLSGTSMATPHVTGGAGLLKSLYPEMSNEEVKRRLIFGSDRSPALQGVSASNGRVNLAASLEPDSLAPGSPNDFGLDGLSTRGGRVRWTTVGDDKWANGPAQHVELYRSDRPLSEENVGQAALTKLTGGSEVGELATFSFSEAPSETAREVHFALRSLDNVGNASSWRFASGEIPAAQVIYRNELDTPDSRVEVTGDFRQVFHQGRERIFTTRREPSEEKVVSTLTTQPIDLSGHTNAFFKFDFQSKLTSNERVIVWASEDGEKWERQAFLRSDSQGWAEQNVNVSEFDGRVVRLRVTVESGSGGSGDFSLDSLRLLTEPT